MKKIHHKIFIFALLFSLVSLVSCVNGEQQEQVIKGEIDLRNFNLKNNETIPLNGKWEFYWHKVLYNRNFVEERIDKIYAEVPGIWNDIEVKNEKIPGEGFATYRLKILHDSVENQMFLKFLNCATACNIYLNDELLFSSGEPSTSKRTSKPSYKPAIAHFHTSGTSSNLIIHVSNFSHRKGGLWEEIHIGKRNAIIKSWEKSMFAEIFLLGALIIMVLYHLMLIVRLPSDTASLYFALFALFIAIRVATTGEHLIYIFGDVNWNIIIRLEYLSFIASPTFFALFVNKYFNNSVNRHFLNSFIVLSVIYAMSLLLPPRLFSYNVVSYQIFILIGGLYFTYIVINEVLKKTTGATVFLVGWIVLFCAVLVDILSVNHFIHSIDLVPYALFIFIFLKSFLLSSRLTKTLVENEKLNRELKYINENQEDILNLRTKQLQNKHSEIESVNQTLMQQKEELKAQTEDLKDAFIEISSKNLEIKQQARQIAAANERFKVLFEKSTESHLIFSEFIVDCNDATLMLLKYPKKEYLLSKSILDISADNQNERNKEEIFREKTENAKKEGFERFEWELLASDDSVVTVDFIINPVEIENENMFLVVWHDMTERIRAEKELKLAHREVMTANQEIIATNIELEMQANELQKKNEEIEHKNRDITSSINYASRIQRAVQTPSEYIDKIIPEHFILYRPRNIVSGDFYWVKQKADETYVIVADCTGHGVPGAFMSLLGVAFLSEIINRKNINSASQVLSEMRTSVIDALNQTGKIGETSDGMDMSLCILNPVKMTINYAGAHNPLYIIRETTETGSFIVNGKKAIEQNSKLYRFMQSKNKTLFQVKADKMPIGVFVRTNEFKNHYIKLETNDKLYMFSDGYIDQFGGERSSKFKSKKFKETLLSIADLPMNMQYSKLQKILEEWMGNTPQVDDIIVMGWTPPNGKVKQKVSLLSDWSDKIILLADDEDLSYILISGLLSSTGANLIRVKDGRQALNTIKENKNIDIVLMDINMPELDGVNATIEIRKFNKDLPIIVITSMGSAEKKHECKEAGCNNFITKPPQMRELISKIGEFIN